MDGLRGHVEVGHESNLVGPKRETRNAQLRKILNDIRGVVSRQREDDDVGFDRIHACDVRMDFKHFAKETRVIVILFKSGDVAIERVKPGRSQHASLAHSPAEHFA